MVALHGVVGFFTPWHKITQSVVWNHNEVVYGIREATSFFRRGGYHPPVCLVRTVWAGGRLPPLRYYQPKVVYHHTKCA